MLGPAERFDEHIRSLDIPIDGVSGEGPMIRIDFKPEATAAQREAARSAAITFDWSWFDRKTAKDILPEAQKLTPEHRQMVITRMIAEYLSTHPALCADVGISPLKSR